MIVFGADMHKRSHTVAAIAASTGELIADRTICVAEQAFVELLAWARTLDDERLWALEDCRGLSDVLCEVGVTDAALGAGKAIHDQPEDQVQREIPVWVEGRREFR